MTTDLKDFPHLVRKNPRHAVTYSFRSIALFWAKEGKLLRVTDSTYRIEPNLGVLFSLHDHAFRYDGRFSIRDRSGHPHFNLIYTDGTTVPAKRIDQVGNRVMVTLINEPNKSYHLVFEDHRVENYFNARYPFNPRYDIDYDVTFTDRGTVLRLPKVFSCTDVKNAIKKLRDLTNINLLSCTENDRTIAVFDRFPLDLIDDLFASLPDRKLKQYIGNQIKKTYHLDEVRLSNLYRSPGGTIYVSADGSGTHSLSPDVVRKLSNMT